MAIFPVKMKIGQAYLPGLEGGGGAGRDGFDMFPDDLWHSPALKICLKASSSNYEYLK